MKSLKEMDGDLINHWYVLALESEVKDKPLRRTVYDTPYVIFRDETKKIRVFEDRCIHRGTQLSMGKCEKGGIRCPYHGWRFHSDGTIAEIPSNGDLVPPKDWRLKAPPQQIQDGCVWIWPGSEEPKLPPPWRFPFHSESEWSQYFMITDFKNEVTNLVQNFMDVPHTVFVHDKWFRRRRQICVPISLFASDGKLKVTYRQQKDEIGFTSKLLNRKKKPMIHTDEFIFPNITRVDYVFGDHQFIINSQCTPISRYQTRVYTWICFRVGWLTPWLKPFLKFYTRQVIQQDVDIMKNQGTNLEIFEREEGPQSFNAKGGYYSSSADELHLVIDRMRSQGAKDKTQINSYSLSREGELWI
ncbi:MAG: aromatic ring-hydroxylating dioxygenase subunit alpha [Pseudomonadota bacterium]|nr:aromatic ring-hydroxylating dioxygenase subunit alpha [Pseudomonadota bacterium]